MKNVLTLVIASALVFSCKKENNVIQRNSATTDVFTPEGIKGVDFSSLQKDSGYYNGFKITYYIYHDSALVYGDILTPLRNITKNRKDDGPASSTSTKQSAKVWPFNTVFYNFAADLSAAKIADVNQAIAHWQANTNITFFQAYGTSNSLTFINSDNGSIASSSIGMAGGNQTIKIPTNYVVGNLIHEIGHSIGLYHEHTRGDRNNFVNVNYSNIQSDYKDQFDQNGENYQSLNGLDFNSIMLYPSFNSFAINPAIPTMTRLDGTTFDAQRIALSQDEISSNILALYPKKKKTGSYSLHQGAGIAVGLINNNNIPDVILMINDAPSGPNTFKYQIAYDVDARGMSTTYSSVISISGVGDGQDGAGCALGNFNNNSIPDLIVMGDDDPSGPNQFRYRIAYDLNANGTPASVSAVKSLPSTGDFSQGAGIAVTNIDNNPLPDLVFMGNDAPSGLNQFRYKIAYNINAAGDYASLSSQNAVLGVGDVQDAANIAVGDINGNGRPDIVFFGDDDPNGYNSLRYKVAFDINTNGLYTSVGSVITRMGLNDYSYGAGACLYDIDQNGVLDLCLMVVDVPTGGNSSEFRYVVGLNLNNQGITNNWR